MRICVATYATGAFSGVCDITDPNKSEYCKRHGYGFERNHEDSPNESCMWDRYDWYLSVMRSGFWDWLYFVDADAMFTNFTVKLESIIKPDVAMIFPIDAVMVQSGGFLAHNGRVVNKFMKKVLSMRNPGTTDQIVIESLLPEYGDLILTIPQRMMGSYDYVHYVALGGNYISAKDRNGNDGQWQPGDFVFHAPGMPIPNKIAVLKSKLDKVVV